jgi:hypothetical protein
VVGKIDSYVIVSRAFIEERLTAQEFETVFLSVFRGEGDRFDADTARAVRTLFDAVDAYCDDPSLRDDDDLDEGGLRHAVLQFLQATGDSN